MNTSTPSSQTVPILHRIAVPDAQGSRRVGVWEWSCLADSAAGEVFCVHGLTRQGRDFDVLAGDLRQTHRVWCLDVAGRGESDWLADPMAYQVPTYVGDVLAVLAHLKLPRVTWVGTSMGGLIGMGLGSLPEHPIERMVLNDVGPVLQLSALQRIASYVGQHMDFASEAEASGAMRQIALGFGPHSDAEWAALSHPMVRTKPEGGVRLHYDPRIGVPMQSMTPESVATAETALWQCWDALKMPVLLLRGDQSDLLSAASVQEMARRGPPLTVREIAGVGHAPTLVEASQRAKVCAFVRGQTVPD